MFEEQIELQTRVITVRPMDLSYILDACPAPSGDPIVPGKTPGNERLRRIHRAIMSYYRNCAVLAWDGGLVVGFVTFYAQGLVPDRGFLCPVDPDSALLQLSPENIPVLSEDVLQVGCLHVVDRPEYRRRGIASLLVRVMVNWAKFQGWKAIEVRGPCFSGALAEHWEQRQPPLDFWKSLGFEPEAVSTDEETRQTRRDFARERGFPGEQTAFTRDWRRVFRRYELVRPLR